MHANCRIQKQPSTLSTNTNRMSPTAGAAAAACSSRTSSFCERVSGSDLYGSTDDDVPLAVRFRRNLSSSARKSRKQEKQNPRLRDSEEEEESESEEEEEEPEEEEEEEAATAAEEQAHENDSKKQVVEIMARDIARLENQCSIRSKAALTDTQDYSARKHFVEVKAPPEEDSSTANKTNRGFWSKRDERLFFEGLLLFCRKNNGIPNNFSEFYDGINNCLEAKFRRIQTYDRYRTLMDKYGGDSEVVLLNKDDPHECRLYEIAREISALDAKKGKRKTTGNAAAENVSVPKKRIKAATDGTQALKKLPQKEANRNANAIAAAGDFSNNFGGKAAFPEKEEDKTFQKLSRLEFEMCSALKFLSSNRDNVSGSIMNGSLSVPFSFLHQAEIGQNGNPPMAALSQQNGVIRGQKVKQMRKEDVHDLFSEFEQQDAREVSHVLNELNIWKHKIDIWHKLFTCYGKANESLDRNL